MYFLADLEKNYYSNNFFGDICKKINSTKGKSSKHIDNIVDLNVNQLWTTNFDSIIEDTVERKLSFKPTIIKESADLLTENLNTRYIVYKLNGSISKPETMVLTKSDFFSYFKNQRLLFEMLKRQLVLDTFLFVGYSFSDDLVLNALREIKDIFPEQGKTHYRFDKQDNDSEKNEFKKYETQYYYDKYKIKTIPIKNYEDIDFFLNKLYTKFCNHNIFIAGSFRQLKNNEERLYIENVVDSLVKKLTDNRFNIYSGNGRGLGEIVTAQVAKHNADKYFVNRPFIFTNDSIKVKTDMNELIMKDCNTMIIICGQDDTLAASENVRRQFQQFNEHDDKEYPLVIPIPSTGYAAKEIFHSDDFKNSNIYLTNEQIFNELEKIKQPDEIAGIVLNIIKSYKNAIS